LPNRTTKKRTVKAKDYKENWGAFLASVKPS